MSSPRGKDVELRAWTRGYVSALATWLLPHSDAGEALDGMHIYTARDLLRAGAEQQDVTKLRASLQVARSRLDRRLARFGGQP